MLDINIEVESTQAHLRKRTGQKEKKSLKQYLLEKMRTWIDGVDHLLEDRREVLDDLVLDFWGQSPPDAVGLVGHKTSHCLVSAISSVKAGPVSLVGSGSASLGPARLVAGSGRRKSIYSR
jgi:hypothetical protein